jgi:hypothetical protein
MSKNALKISDVLTLLSNIKEKHGDLTVLYSSNDDCDKEVYCLTIETDFKVREKMGIDGENALVINPFQNPLITAFKEIK